MFKCGWVMFDDRVLLLRFKAGSDEALDSGFAVGRLSEPSTETLMATLEPSLKASLEADIRASVQRKMDQQWTSYTAEHTDQIQPEMVLIMRQALGESMTRTRTVCQAYTEQRLRELTQLIERARIGDRRYMATALESMEAQRQQDKDLVKRGIVALTLQTRDRPVHVIN